MTQQKMQLPHGNGPRVKPIIKFIEKQLMLVKEVLAKAMLDDAINLKNHIKSLEKYSLTTIKDIFHEPQILINPLPTHQKVQQ
jgi:hypothetical protein